MMKRYLRKSSLLLCILITYTSIALAQQKTLPNIVVVLIDDMGYADVGSFGATGYKTPNIDKLAEQGARFTNFYSAQPICTASRAGLLTGCYPNRIGLSGALFPGSKIGLSNKEVTIAELLRPKGYKSIIIGKWHLGDSRQFLPLQHGFDEYFGIPYSNDMSPLGTSGRAEENSKRANLPYLPLIEGNDVVRSFKTLNELSELTTLYTERAVKFIRESNKQPFFLYLAHSMVHVPLFVSGKFKGKSKKGIFGDVMMEVDWSVGEVMKALREKGIENNTLVIFTSDNGPWLTFGDHAGSAGILREGKQTSWEGGQRVSCIMRWPGVIPTGKVNDGLACSIDLLPTIAAITNTPQPPNKIDGVNILPLLKGGNVSPRNELLYYYKANDLDAIRLGKWKLVFPHLYVKLIVPGKDGFPGKTEQTPTELALYDLTQDPGEKNDLKDKFPDVVKQLQEAGDRAREDLGDNLTKMKGKNRREPGKLQGDQAPLISN